MPAALSEAGAGSGRGWEVAVGRSVVPLALSRAGSAAASGVTSKFFKPSTNDFKCFTELAKLSD
ncbi:hypothetical protein OJ996_05415 [Luteolibacter sp. GHJ8]|uniref:Uncharacterized protein n=1 Tax=Luteolibacter rhizosphaerae TaxID=2989719 RepID=A0ABT3FZI1_9BACT|nr:hypothetical protein [Luteolibacter rhizosphaerae]MCW1912998.1 hypothetical protein [Luteolibacter rhizosphaerae]